MAGFALFKAHKEDGKVHFASAVSAFSEQTTVISMLTWHGIKIQIIVDFFNARKHLIFTNKTTAAHPDNAASGWKKIMHVNAQLDSNGARPAAHAPCLYIFLQKQHGVYLYNYNHIPIKAPLICIFFSFFS